MYDVFRILFSYVWTRIANLLGLNISINISLICLTVCNFSFAYSKTLFYIIVNRSLTGMFNNLTIFSKQYIYEFFNFEENSHIMNFFLTFQNITTIIGIIIGSLSCLLNEFDSSNDVNKYFISCWIVAFINFVTILFNLVKFRFKFIIPKRRTTVIKKSSSVDNSNRKSKDLKTSDFNLNNDIMKVNRSSENGNNNMDVVNLDLFSSNKDNNDKFNSKIYEEKSDMSISTKKKTFIKLEEEILDTNENQEIKKEEDKSKSEKVILDRNRNTENKVILSNRISIKDQITDKKKNLNDSVNDIKKLNRNDSMVLGRSLISNSSSSLNISSFKISLIFTFIQISDVILYNSYFVLLVLPKEYSGYGYGIFDIAYYLTVFHLIYSLLIPIIYKLIIKNVKTNNKSVFWFKIFSLVALLFSIVFYANSYYYRNNRLNISVSLFILRNLALMGSSTCYNIMIVKIPDSEYRDKLGSYHNYFSFLMRALFGIILCYIIVYFNDLLELIYIIITILMIFLLLINYKLINVLNELIS